MAINAEQNQLKQANQGDQQQTGAGATQAPSTSRISDYSSGASPATQGSGRFTNLKKYVNANQGAGEQLGSKISGNIDRNVEKTNKEATSAAGNVANAVNAEKDRLSQGNQFNQQLQDQSENGAQAIYGNEENKTRFSNLLNNQNIASNLSSQAQTASDAANRGLNAANQQVQNLGTEQGRFSLLQQSVKSPQYTQGQQRLDQLMLQAGNPNQLVQNQRDLQGKVQNYGSAIANQYGDIGSQIGQVGTQAQDISKLLGSTLGSETQNLVNAQNTEAGNLNTQNALANSALETYFTNGSSALTNPAQKAAMDQMLASSGLTQGMRTYNVLKDPGSYQNYIDNARVNLGSQDVLDANELARYNALYGLSGGTGDRAFLDQVGDRGPAAGIKSSLGTDISKSADDFRKQMNQQYTFNPNAGSGITSNAQTNYLDLLSYLEAGKTGSESVDGESPIYQTNGPKATKDWDIYSGNRGVGSNYLAPWDASLGGNTRGYAGNNAITNLYNDFMKRISESGYTNNLGGVTGTGKITK